MTKAAPHSLPLPGLSENNPRDFLAALGLLRLATLLWPALDPKLAWDPSQRHPVLHTGDLLPHQWDQQLTEQLKSLAADPIDPLFHGEVIRTSPAAFDAALRKAAAFAETSDHPLRELPGLLYNAYSSQNAEDEEIHISAFSFANGGGGKSLLRDVRELIAELGVDEIGSALAGTARPVAAKSLRWNPVEFRAAAFRGPDPGKGIKGDDTLDYPAFNVLAFAGLTFFPCAPSLRFGLTLGMHSKDREFYFIWPIWSHPSSADVVASILNQDPDKLRPSHGISRRWQSRRFTADKSVYFSTSSAMS
jgi:hypothetical protein